MAKDYASSQRSRLSAKRTISWYQQPSSLLWVVAMVVFAMAGVSYYLWPQHPASIGATTSAPMESNTPQTPPHAPQLAQQSIPLPKPRFDFYELLPNQTVKTAYTVAEQKASEAAAAAAKDDEIAEAEATTALSVAVPQAVATQVPAKAPAVNVANMPSTSSVVHPSSEPEERASVTAPEKKASVAAAEPEKKALSPVSAESARNYFLQVASFARLQDADNLRARLLLLGFSAKVEAPQAKGQKYYRIVVGPFSRMEVAQQAQQRLTEAHYSSLLLIVKQGSVT